MRIEKKREGREPEGCPCQANRIAAGQAGILRLCFSAKALDSLLFNGKKVVRRVELASGNVYPPHRAQIRL